MSDVPRVVIAGGGSGGHVFPGLAIASALRDGADVDVVFAGTARGLEATVVPAKGYRLELLDVRPIQGGGPSRAAVGVLVAARATVRALSLVRSLAPRVVVSVGGYAAGPFALAAGILGVPVAIVEPNGVAGLANRILGPFARRAYVAWGPAAASFSPRKSRAFGVPIRRGFRPAPAGLDACRVLVLGGSQGAHALNEIVPEALAGLARERPDLEVLHQTGEGRAEAVRGAYARAGMTSARVVPFLDDVASELVWASVVVARSGAGTVAEVAAVGRPALLVPFPFAADDHQAENALALERAGGGICLRQERADAPRVTRELGALLGDRGRRARMSEASRRFGRPDAARDVARDLCDLAGIAWRATPRGPERSNGATRPAEVV